MCRIRPIARLIATFAAKSAVASALLLPACRQEEPARSELPKVDASPKKQSDVLIFPDMLRVADEGVNEFVARAMTICGQGEYEPFRLLWSVRETPLTRGQFDEGWHAVQRIEIKALREARLVLPTGADAGIDPIAGVTTEKPAPDPAAPSAKPESTSDAGKPTADPATGADDGETVYLILAEVSLDPEHAAARQSPTREVVLMLVRERDHWRIANTPKPLRDWVRGTVKPPQVESAIP